MTITRPAIVLLGATGFVGSSLLRQLATAPYDGVSVHILVRDPTRLSSYGRRAAVRVMTGELGRPPRELFPAEPHIVIHVATRQIAREKEFESNVSEARALADALPASTRGILYGSSASVYGQGSHVDVDESHPLWPGTALARSRVEAEAVLIDAARRRGVTAYCLRPRMIFGAGDRHTLPGLERMLRRRVQPGSGSQRFSVLDVDDYARIFLALCHRMGTSDTPEQAGVNAAYSRSLSLDDVTGAICRARSLPRAWIRLPVTPWIAGGLRTIPSEASRALATRLELYGLDHTYRVERARALVGGDVVDNDPLERFEAAVARA